MSTVEKAVQAAIDQRPPAADTRKVLPENIPNDAKQVACSALDKAYDTYHEKDGILDLQARVAEKLEKGVAWQAMVLAQTAVEISGNDMRLAGPMFRALCDVGEKHLRATHAENGVEPPIVEMLPSWANIKAGVARTLDKGINPKERNPVGNSPVYPTASKFITAGKDTSPRTKDTKAVSNKVVALELVQKGFNAGLSAAMTVLYQSLSGLNDAGQTKAAQEIATVAGTIKDFGPEFRTEKQVAQATTGNAENDAKAAAKIAAERANAPAPARKGRK